MRSFLLRITVVWLLVCSATLLSRFAYPLRSTLELWDGRFGGSQSCEIADLEPELAMKYGEYNLDRSITYSGTGHLIREALMRPAEGSKTFKIGVLGGSISAGQKIQPHEVYHKRIADWVQRTYPEVEVQVFNGASPGQGSPYFASCYSAMIPLDVDLIILESAINDEYSEETKSMWDTVLRSLLDLPSRPAIVSMETFILAGHSMPGRNAADIYHTVTQYFNVPSFSWRDMMYTSFQVNASSAPEYFNEDLVHPKGIGHEIMGDIVVAYLSRQLCLAKKAKAREEVEVDPRWPSMKIHDQIPMLTMNDKWNWHHNPRVEPMFPSCLSTNSVNQEYQLQPVATKGFEKWESHPKKKYWRALEAGSEISFNIKVPANGESAIMRLVSVEFGLGDFRCWWDDNEAYHVDVAGYHTGRWWGYINIGWPHALPKTTPGDHLLTCRVLETTSDHNKGGHEVRIIAVMDNLYKTSIYQPPHDGKPWVE